MDDSYESRKDRERDRQADQSRRGREIGPLPKCADKRRRTRCEKSLKAFCETYFPGRFSLAWSTDHLEQLAEIERVITEGGLQAIAAPRGDGKTTRLEVGILWGVMAIAAHQYAVLLAATGKMAPKLMSSIKTELSNNELLLADFPEVCYPIHKLSGIAQKTSGQLLDGKHTWPPGGDKPWARTRIVLPTVVGSPCSGAVIEASGLLEATRGIKFTRADGTIARPSVALIDDPQTNRSAKSVVQCQEREEALAGGIIHLCGPNRSISALASLTVIRPGDMADQMLKRDVHPEWHGIRKRLLDKWPLGCDPKGNNRQTPDAIETAKRWDEYGELYRLELGEGGTGKKASSYYRRHRKVMDRGGKASWPQRKPGCVSATEFAMRMFYRDRASMLAELQNDPEEHAAEAAFEMLTVEELTRKISGYGEGIIPADCRRLTWFCDVQQELLYYAVCAWGPGFTGHVIEYATWPHQSARYFELRHARQTIAKAKEITATTLEGRISQALDALGAELAGREWRTDAGEQVELELGLVDANWGQTTDQVYAFCAQARRKHGVRVMPSHGMPFGPAKCPISRWDRKKTKGAFGDEWHVPPPSRGRAIRHVIFDAGRRKAFLHRRLATPAGDPGSLVLYHAPAGWHRLLAEHVTAETGVTVSGPYGELIAWTLTPGRDNHWLDCLSGCCTAESILGAKLRPPTATAPAPIPKPQKPAPAKQPRVQYIDL